MTESDIDPVVDIIEKHDDDDAAVAYRSFKKYGTQGHCVLVGEKNIARGVSGVFQGTELSYWLSWTYLREELRGQGLGRKLGNYAVNEVKKKGGKLLFISTSDYKVRGIDIYQDAKNFYLAMGAVEEMVIPDYFQRGESHCVFRLAVENFENLETPSSPPLVIQFTGMQVIKETKVAYALTWEEAPEEHMVRTQKELEKLVSAAKRTLSHAVFFSVPSDFDLRQKTIVEAFGFRQVGKLRDYFIEGVDELHFAYYFERN